MSSLVNEAHRRTMQRVDEKEREKLRNIMESEIPGSDET
jgi:hypothetical protein